MDLSKEQLDSILCNKCKEKIYKYGPESICDECWMAKMKLQDALKEQK